MNTNPPVTLTYSIEDLFTRFEQSISKQIAEVNEKVDRQSAETKQQFAEVNQKVDSQFADVKQQLLKLEVGQAELAGDIKALNERFAGEIKTLDATVAGIGKRVDNAEFFNRGVAIALIAAVFGGLIKWFDWFPIN